MNKKVLIIFLVVITVFVFYFLITKSKEQKLCEEYGGEWLSKDIWDISTDTCEFVYLFVHDIPNYEKYFDGDEPNEDFYLQSEREQKYINAAKNHISSLEEEYEKEINIAKKYCTEVGGRFEKGIRDYKSMTGHARKYIVYFHWAVRCYIKS